MIDIEKLDKIRSGEAFQGDTDKLTTMLSTLDLGELLALRSQIDARLPMTQLSEMNLEEELVRQYLTVQAVQTACLADSETPANQKAQVANSVPWFVSKKEPGCAKAMGTVDQPAPPTSARSSRSS